MLRIFSAFCFATPLLAATGEIALTGDGGEAVEFGTVIIPEAKFKANFYDGKLVLPELKPGKYTLRLTAPGRISVENEITIPLKKNTVIQMPLQTQRTQKVRLITHDEKHNVSMHKVQQHELKSVPA